ncbi:hypothetical protein BKA58DRAFT_459023, partial [Alternaria rosae]|uniref:uncharacterized protein n=1 Tax=Alternaria rosae TaxID=1187941 RepID=UPI001E8E5EA8
MTEQTPLRQKRVAPEANPGINGLIAACNKNDRFKLLEDESVLPGDLRNSIHPTLRWFDSEGPMRQMLQLASHFLSHDTVLAFFVPLLYGRDLISIVDDARKTYLSDPLAHASEEKRGQYLAGVREALHCLGHSVSFQFLPSAKRRKFSCRIEMADWLRNFYSTGEYEAASRCAQFRHDFLFAATLVHEIAHAVGILRRGNTKEPHIRADCPEAEWGYGWEHFMFGAVINPQDLSVPGTHLLMRKIWVDRKTANEIGGKEYCDVPMSYIAQWFRNKTWSIVAKYGPTTVAAPIANFKVRPSDQRGAWVVSSDHPEIEKDLRMLQSHWRNRSLNPSLGVGSSSSPAARSRFVKIFWHVVTTEQLQKNNAPVPLRTSIISRADTGSTPKPTQTIRVCCKPTNTQPLAGCQPNYSDGCDTSRKRPAESRKECCRVSKAMK